MSRRRAWARGLFCLKPPCSTICFTSFALASHRHLQVLPSLVEKNYNQTLNVWFRAPLSAHIGVMQMLGM